MTASLIDRTVSQIVTPDGDVATKPTTIIGTEAAQIMRAWFYWAMSHQLEPELYCANCAKAWARSAKATYNITETEIQIICECQLRFFQGASLPPDPIGHSVTKTHEGDGAAVMQLSDGAARLLRLCKKVLIDLNLKEALRCNICYQLNNGGDGCEAQVLTNSIRIHCRCTDRVYSGSTM